MRSAGILMPISSLPSPYGIGTMGKAARDFIKFLSDSGQTYWQILPICPTSYGDSPYQSFSSYAGNPYFIDLDDLYEDGLLEKEDYQSVNWGNDPQSIDYGIIYKNRYPVLKKACNAMLKKADCGFQEFCKSNAKWLDDYALFMAVKDKFGGKSWFEWPQEIRRRNKEVLEKLEKELADEITFWKAVQFLFLRQWKVLKQNAADNGIQIIGDLPIYVAGDSADVWAHTEQFQMDKNLLPKKVAGCPPDAFSEDGQLWGNPLFNWSLMKKENYSWWIDRIAYQFKIYDVLRIDHFRAFDAYYAIPYGDKTARNGKWKKGPGIGFFKAVEKALGKKEIIAEDLGFLTESVHKLLRQTKFPGMKVLEFAFDSRDKTSDYLPHRYTPHCIVYTGTHDNDTIMGWIETSDPDDVEYAREYLGLNEDEGYNWGMMRGAWSSVADTAIMQMQDLLGLSSEARINTPSTVGTNWKWRALEGSYNKELAEKLYNKMKIYNRLGQRQADKKEL